MENTTHSLPPPFATGIVPGETALPPPKLVTQGAEALIYKTCFLSDDRECALKFRPRKSYRHPTLDARLTKARILAEARVLVRCRKDGVSVPAILGLDWDDGWLALEWIDGSTIRACLDRYLHTLSEEEEQTLERRSELWELMAKVGRAVGKLHEVGVVHGDLTTSNLMLRPKIRKVDAAETAISTASQGHTEPESASSTIAPPSDAQDLSSPDDLEGDIILIDFGLATQSIQDEDRAVDLYVLERAFASTHPQAEPLFKEVLRIYGESYTGAKKVLKRLDDVRLRGRKKSMIG